MDINAGIEKLIDSAKESYRNWILRGDNVISDEILDAAIERFNNGFSVKKGKKYIKIIHEGSAWAFIVNVHDDRNFKYGDILKPASWSAPTRNAPRGNVLEGTKVFWTGPAYL